MRESKSDFINLEETWSAAMQDKNLNLLRELLDDEFQALSWRSSGDTLAKDQYIAEVARGQLECCKPSDISVQIIGNVAITRLLLHCDTAGSQSCEWSPDFLISDVWIKRPSGWRAVSRHSTVLASAVDSAISVLGHS